MAGSVNKVIIVGNLGADPEVKSFQNGGRVCNLRIATSEDWKDKNYRRKKRTHRMASGRAFDRRPGGRCRALSCAKAAKVYIEGQLQTRKWQEPSGNDRYTTEIRVGGFDGKLVMLDGAKGGSGGGGGSSEGWAAVVRRAAVARVGSNWQGGSSGFGGGDFDNDLDDDVPF